MNAPGRIADLMTALTNSKARNSQITYLDFFHEYFGVKSVHEIMLRLFWLDRELAICRAKVPNNDYNQAFEEAEYPLRGTCLRENVQMPSPVTIMAFNAMRDFLFSAEHETPPEVFEEINRAIEDLRASITDDEDEQVKESLESIAVSIEQSVDASIKYGAQPLKDRVEIALGKLVLIGDKIKSEETKEKVGKLVKAFYVMCEKANIVVSFIENITKLLE
jgi:hypothetical protein